MSKAANLNTTPSARRARPASRRPPGKDDGTQLERLRRLCLSIPGTVEKISHGEPTFFTPKRVFAMFANNHHDDGRVAAWLPAGAGVQEALIEEAPRIFFRPPYVGPAGWIGVELSNIDDAWLASLVREANQLITEKERRVRTRRSGKQRSTRR